MTILDFTLKRHAWWRWKAGDQNPGGWHGNHCRGPVEEGDEGEAEPRPGAEGRMPDRDGPLFWALKDELNQ